jgi:uncharacterized delta-60 repeat protein
MFRSRRRFGLIFLVAASGVLFFASLVAGAGGELDPGFGIGGKVVTDLGSDESAIDVAAQRDGKIVVAGVTSGRSFVARYTAAGALDATFGSGGIARHPVELSASAIAIQADGKIVTAGGERPAGGSNLDFILTRLNTDGTLDSSFDGDGRVFTDFGLSDVAFAVAIQPDGKIVAAGLARSSSGVDSREFAVARYSPDGGLDASFDGDGRAVTPFTSLADVAWSVALQPDGKIVVGGHAGFSSATPDAPYDAALARYNADGSLDSSFDSDGKVTTPGGSFTSEVDLQRDGKILVAGGSITRYNRNGSPDSTFGAGGRLTPNISVRSLAVQADRKIVAAGDLRGDFALLRLLPSGALDENFGASFGYTATDIGQGSNDLVAALAIQPDRRIVLAGAAYTGPSGDIALARYLNPAPPTCLVPKVRGKTLRAARASLTRARCRVGRITRRASTNVTKGRVIAQRPAAGRRLPAASKVNLVVSRGRR